MDQHEPVDLLHFTWSVPDRGYVWRDDMASDAFLGGREKPPFLLVDPKAHLMNRYTPVKVDELGGEAEPLFQRFAKLEATQASIKQFADQWGWLGVGGRVVPTARKGKVRVEKGESLEVWAREILDMRLAVALWTRLDWPDDSVRVKWESKSYLTVQVDVPGRRKPVRIPLDQQFHEDLFRILRRNDPSRAVRAALLVIVNEKLAGKASPCLLLNRLGQLKGFVRPHNLLAALWVQVYQAAIGWRHLRSCIHCGELMDVTGSRRSKKAHGRCVHNAKMSKYWQKRKLKTEMKNGPRQ